ncbi:hypothetical protein BDV93DRAFT_285171 [Ceratobasidium sp. AG-I]|nr:hypothetical protein BDV93DRAFT_285171 [Ceratobasidium sp. AG-I]
MKRCGASLKVLNLRVLVLPGIHIEAMIRDTTRAERLAALLSGFRRLMCFQIEALNIPFLLGDKVKELGSAGTLEFWVRQRPSLRRVILFGVELS